MNKIPTIAFTREDNELDFEIINLKSLFSRFKGGLNHNPHLPHRLDFFGLLLITKGTGKHHIDLKEYIFSQGNTIKISKGQVHAFQENPTYEGYLFIFTESFILNYFSKKSIQLISYLYNYHINSPKVESNDFNKQFIEQLKAELAHKSTYAQKNIVAALLEIYLLQLERSTQSHRKRSKDNAGYDFFYQFKNLVEKKYASTRNVIDYAYKLGVSTKYLNEICKEFTLHTAKYFIDNYVILEIKRAIISSDLSLKEICYSTGFNETTNFTKYFKKHTGFTPKEFKSKQ